ncbi:unnamed protein product [Prorocentrum cordatum]|uniref:Uncharacterized protein n=1 Tax=Prorocentrum cordatum TaxID=2364126 RepID=A0ABN9XAI5_9DINO|nr:unnamed protein product [Polarella glacialis]
MRFSASKSENSDVGAYKLKGESASRKDGAPGDDDLMDLIWGGSETFAGQDDEGGRGQGSGSRGSGGRGQGPRPSPSKAIGKATTSKAPSKTTDAKIMKEFEASEKAVLSADHMLRKLEDSQRIGGITVDAFVREVAKLDQRLTPELTILYSKDYNGTDGTPGMTVYEDLQKARDKLRSCDGVVVCLNAKDGERTSAESLLAEHNIAKGAGVQIASFVLETVVIRGFSEARREKNWGACQAILSSRSPSSENPIKHEFGFHLFEKEADVQVLQSHLLLVTIIEMLKGGQGAPPGHSESEALKQVRAAAGDLHTFLHQVALPPDVRILDSTMRDHVERLGLLTSAAVGTVPEDTLKVERALQELRSAKEGPFYKALFMFETGKHIVKVVTDLLARWAADKRFTKEVADLKLMCQRLPQASANIEKVAETGAMQCRAASQSSWTDARKKLVTIEANCTDAFKKQHAAALEECKATLGSMETCVASACRAHFAAACSSILPELTAAIGSGLPIEGAADKLKTLDDAIVGISQTPLVTVASESSKNAYKDDSAKMSAFVVSLRILAPLLHCVTVNNLSAADACLQAASSVKVVFQDCSMLDAFQIALESKCVAEKKRYLSNLVVSSHKFILALAPTMPGLQAAELPKVTGDVVGTIFNRDLIGTCDASDSAEASGFAANRR